MNENVINHCINEINHYFNIYRDTKTALHYSSKYLFDCFSYGIVTEKEYLYLKSYLELKKES